MPRGGDSVGRSTQLGVVGVRRGSAVSRRVLPGHPRSTVADRPAVDDHGQLVYEARRDGLLTPGRLAVSA